MARARENEAASPSAPMLGPKLGPIWPYSTQPPMRRALATLALCLAACALLARADDSWEGVLEGETETGWLPLARLRSDQQPFPTPLSTSATSAVFKRLRLDGRIDVALPAACPPDHLPADLELWVSEGQLRGAATAGACTPRTFLRVRQRVVGEPARPAKQDIAAAQGASR